MHHVDHFRSRPCAAPIVLAAALAATLAACGGSSAETDNGTASLSIATQPASTSVAFGSAATFSVAVPGAAGYQWQISSDGGTSWSDVPTATASAYTTAGTTVADDGIRYRVMASNAAGSATSAAAVLTVVAPPPWNAAGDFSAKANPSGAWSYGWYPRKSLDADPVAPLNLYVSANTYSEIDFWHDPANLSGGAPLVSHNPTAATISSITAPWTGGVAQTSIAVPPNALLLHPGPVTALALNSSWSVVRWTAPFAGNYKVTASFAFADPTPTGVDVHVFVNGVAAMSTELLATGAPRTDYESAAMTMTAGTTVDLAVGPGANGNYSNDSTFVSATVQAVR